MGDRSSHKVFAFSLSNEKGFFSLKLNSLFLVSWVIMAVSGNTVSPLKMQTAGNTVELTHS